MVTERTVEDLREDALNLKIKLINTLGMIGKPRMDDKEKSLLVELVNDAEIRWHIARTELILTELKNAVEECNKKNDPE